MSKRVRVFSDVTTVSRDARSQLKRRKLIDGSDQVVSWVRLSGFISNSLLTEKQAKQLTLLEMERESPRQIILERLVNYISSSRKRELLKKINKHLN